MSVPAAVRRHRGELGEAIAVFRDRPPLGVILLAVTVWLLCCGISLINPPDTAVQTVSLFAAYAVFVFGFLGMMSGEVLIVCARGLIIGSTALGLRPYVVRFEQMTPGGVVPLRRARRLPRQLGFQGVRSTFRTNPWIDRAVYLTGPSAAQARRHRALIAPVIDGGAWTADDKHMWLIGVNRAPEEAVAAIASAARASGHTALARAAEEAAQQPVRTLTGRPRDAAEQIPGLHPGIAEALRRHAR